MLFIYFLDLLNDVSTRARRTYIKDKHPFIWFSADFHYHLHHHAESIKKIWVPFHTGLSMYMVPLKKWWQHGPDSNLAISISLYSKSSFDEGPFFAIFCWKAVQGLKHIYVVKNTSSEIINCLDFILWKPFLAFRGH